MPQNKNRKKVRRTELETVQGIMVAFREAVQESLDRMSNGNQDHVPANQIAMWASHLTIASYVAEQFVRDIENKLQSLEDQESDVALYLPEQKRITDA